MVVPNSCKTLKTVQYNLFGECIDFRKSIMRILFYKISPIALYM